MEEIRDEIDELNRIIMKKSYLNHDVKIKGSLMLPDPHAGPLFLDRDRKIESRYTIITLTSTYNSDTNEIYLPFEVPDNVFNVEIECIGGGGGGGGGGNVGHTGNITPTGSGIPGSGGGGSAAQKQIINVKPCGILRCYVGNAGNGGEIGSTVTNRAGSGGGGGGNGGNSAVVQYYNDTETLLCCALGGNGGGGGGGSSYNIDGSLWRGGRGGNSSEPGFIGSSDSSQSIITGALAGTNGDGYQLSSFVRQLRGGGDGGISISELHGYGGNGGNVFYPNSGTGGGGYTYNIPTVQCLAGQAPTEYQKGSQGCYPTGTYEGRGGNGGPSIFGLFSNTSSNNFDSFDKGGAPGSVHFMDSTSAPGRGGQGGNFMEQGYAGNNGHIVLRFGNPLDVV